MKIKARRADRTKVHRAVLQYAKQLDTLFRSGAEFDVLDTSQSLITHIEACRKMADQVHARRTGRRAEFVSYGIWPNLISVNDDGFVVEGREFLAVNDAYGPSAATVSEVQIRLSVLGPTDTRISGCNTTRVILHPACLAVLVPVIVTLFDSLCRSSWKTFDLVRFLASGIFARGKPIIRLNTSGLSATEQQILEWATVEAVRNWNHALTGVTEISLCGPGETADVTITAYKRLYKALPRAAYTGAVRPWRARESGLGAKIFVSVRDPIGPSGLYMSPDATRSILIHELGHFLLLDEWSFSGSVMGPDRLDRPDPMPSSYERDALVFALLLLDHPEARQSGIVGSVASDVGYGVTFSARDVMHGAPRIDERTDAVWQGDRYAKSSDFANAIMQYEIANVIDHDDFNTQARIGYCLAGQQPEAAIKWLRLAARRKHDSRSIACKCGIYFVMSRMYQAAGMPAASVYYELKSRAAQQHLELAGVFLVPFATARPLKVANPRLLTFAARFVAQWAMVKLYEIAHKRSLAYLDTDRCL